MDGGGVKGVVGGIRIRLRGDGIEDTTDGADEVKVDDRTPSDTFGMESSGCMKELKFCSLRRQRSDWSVS